MFVVELMFWDISSNFGIFHRYKFWDIPSLKIILIIVVVKGFLLFAKSRCNLVVNDMIILLKLIGDFFKINIRLPVAI